MMNKGHNHNWVGALLIGAIFICSSVFVAPLFAQTAIVIDVSSQLEKLNSETLALQAKINAALSGSTGSPDKATLSEMLQGLNNQYEEIKRILAFQPGVTLKARRAGDNDFLSGALTVSDSDAVDLSWTTVNSPDSCSASSASTKWTGGRSGISNGDTISKGGVGNGESYSIVCTKTDTKTGTIYQSLPSTVTFAVKPVAPATPPSVHTTPQVTPRLISGSATSLGFDFTGLESGTAYTLKRKEGNAGDPKNINPWVEVSTDVSPTKLPSKDDNLTSGKEYSYALFTQNGTEPIPGQTISSQIPNREVNPLPDETDVVGGNDGHDTDPGRGGGNDGIGGTGVGDTGGERGGTPDNRGGDAGNKAGDATPLGLTVTTLIGRIQGILNAIIPFIIGLAVFVILWGIFTYITHAAEEEKRAEARQFIIWGIIGVFFMLSVWGFVNLLLNSFDVRRDIQEGDLPKVPTVVGPN